MAKQVQTKSTEAPVEQQEAPASGNNPQSVFVSVKTFDGATGKPIGERVVDMHHFGTRNWLQNHLWWASHQKPNGHQVEISMATDEEIAYSQQAALEALSAKYAPKRAGVKAA